MTLVLLALLLSCRSAFAQAALTPRQVYESYQQASARNEDVSQFRLPVSTAKLNEIRKKWNELPADKKAANEGLRKFVDAAIPKNEKFLNETTDGDTARLLYGLGYDKGGYTEVVLKKFQGVWKIESLTHNMSEKPPLALTSQKLVNTAYGATRRQFPQVPVQGRVNGIDFRPNSIKLWDPNTLTFSYPQAGRCDRGITIWFHSFKGSLINTRMSQTEAPPIDSDKGKISVWVEEKGKETKRLEAGTFGIQLALSPKNSQGLVPGYIILQTTDPQTFIAGYFYATE